MSVDPTKYEQVTAAGDEVANRLSGISRGLVATKSRVDNIISEIDNLQAEFADVAIAMAASNAGGDVALQAEKDKWALLTGRFGTIRATAVSMQTALAPIDV